MDKLHVSYHGGTKYALKYATKMFNTVLGTWTRVSGTVDNSSKIYVTGYHTDIIVTEDGTVYIAYYDEVNGEVKLAYTTN